MSTSAYSTTASIWADIQSRLNRINKELSNFLALSKELLDDKSSEGSLNLGYKIVVNELNYFMSAVKKQHEIAEVYETWVNALDEEKVGLQTDFENLDVALRNPN
jgi:chromosome condensin MukBEF ATPase and DNA-binding subunit MukB